MAARWKCPITSKTSVYACWSTMNRMFLGALSERTGKNEGVGTGLSLSGVNGNCTDAVFFVGQGGQAGLLGPHAHGESPWAGDRLRGDDRHRYGWNGERPSARWMRPDSAAFGPRRWAGTKTTTPKPSVRASAGATSRCTWPRTPADSATLLIGAPR